MMKKFELIGFVLMLALVACTKEAKRNASDLMQDAQRYYEQDNLNAAKRVIDSIHTVFHQNIPIRTQARDLMYRIQLREEKRNVVFYDSLLSVQSPILAKEAKQFVLSKDSAYVNYKLYTPRVQTIGYMPHTNLVTEIKDNGELILISVFMGRKLNHTAIRVTAKDVFAESAEIPLSSANNNRFDDMGTRWEYVTIREDAQNDIPGFIANYADQPLKVTLKGEKSTYSYFLNVRDKQAIAASVRFAAIVKEVYLLNLNHQKSIEKIDWLEQKLK